MEQPSDPGASAAARLHTFGGPAPANLAADLQHLGTLPDSVQQVLWELLQPNLGAHIDERVEAFVLEFARNHGIAMTELVPVVRGCRRLFLEAARGDVPLEHMSEDLRILCDSASLARTILGAYRKALPHLRAQRLMQSLGDFGPVLEDLKLRTDYVPASRHAPGGVMIALLSLGYRENDERKRLTLQVPAPLLAQLRAALESLGK